MLTLDDIHKSYGDRKVLDGIGFTIEPGRMTGFIGGNGAGKTTTMRIILGLLAADRGAVVLEGRPVTALDRRRFGYMPEERGLYAKMGVREQLVYLARLHGWSAADGGRHADALLEQLDLTARSNDHIETLSLGNQQRAQVAAALVHRPDILILDEPFSGLDPIAVERVQTVLRGYADDGAPVLFSSHQLDIVERLCDDLVILGDGRVRAAGEREALRSANAGDRWELGVAETGWVAGWLRDHGGEVVGTTSLGVLLEAETGVRQKLVAEAASRGEVHVWRQAKPRLAEIFKEVVA